MLGGGAFKVSEHLPDDHLLPAEFHPSVALLATAPQLLFLRSIKQDFVDGTQSSLLGAKRIYFDHALFVVEECLFGNSGLRRPYP